MDKFSMKKMAFYESNNFSTLLLFDQVSRKGRKVAKKGRKVAKKEKR